MELYIRTQPRSIYEEIGGKLNQDTRNICEKIGTEILCPLYSATIVKIHNSYE